MARQNLALEVLDAWNVTPSGPVEGIDPKGTFRIPMDGGDDLILTCIGGDDARTAEQAALEHGVLQHLDGSGLPVAVPLRDRQGRTAVPHGGCLYALVPRLRGSQGGSKPTDCDELYRSYGGTIARMHMALATFRSEPVALSARREALLPKVFDYGVPYLQGYLNGAEAGRLQAMMADVGEVMRQAFKELPEQLIHRDCHTGNLLSRGTAVTGIIDWDHLCVGVRVFDLAYFAAQLGKRHVGDPDTMVQWIRDVSLVLLGYHQECHLSDGERAAFVYVVIGVFIAFAGWEIEVGWVEALQTELDAMAWMYDNLGVIGDQVATVFGGQGAAGGARIPQEEHQGL
ncbi:MAG: phosphotransferase [Anaerolineae bacterium]|nr:phosphotransferase [Anaerolineae bacterium]